MSQISLTGEWSWWKNGHTLLAFLRFTRFFSLSAAKKSHFFQSGFRFNSLIYINEYQNLFILESWDILQGWMRCGLSFQAVKKCAQPHFSAPISQSSRLLISFLWMIQPQIQHLKKYISPIQMWSLQSVMPSVLEDKLTAQRCECEFGAFEHLPVWALSCPPWDILEAPLAPCLE